MNQKEIRVAVLGCGGRARGTIRRLLEASENRVKVRTVFDPDREEAKGALDIWQTPDAEICNSFEEAIRRPEIDWAMVFSPNAFHKEQIVCALKAGKDVFSEKPLATRIEDCLEINRVHQESGRMFATGFVLRYAPIYRKVKELLSSGELGRLLSIDANENISPEHGGYILCNWRRKTARAGPHILEQCCHDLDLINWFCDSLPSRVASFGGRNLFLPENRYLEEKYGRGNYIVWRDPHRLETPFNSDSDLMDNQVSIAEYRNGIRVMFQSTMSNPLPERRMYFSCTEGNMIAELYTGVLRVKHMGRKYEERYEFGGDGHGGGDDFIMKELYEYTMCNQEPPRCSGREGLESAVLALSFDQSARTGAMVDLESVWRTMGR